MVTHDPIAASYADRVVFLADGRIVDELRDPTADAVLDKMRQLGRLSRACGRSRSRASSRTSSASCSPASRSSLGVAFMSGTFVLTDTISQHVRRPVRRHLRGHRRGGARPGGVRAATSAAAHRAARSPTSLLDDRARGARASTAADGTVQIGLRADRRHERQRARQPGQGAPTLGFGGSTTAELNPFHLVPGGRRPAPTTRSSSTRARADKGDFKVGDTVDGAHRPSRRKHVHARRDREVRDGRQPARRVDRAVHAAARRSGRRHTPGQFDRSRVVADPGVSQDAGRSAASQDVDRGRQRRGDHRQASSPRRTRTTSTKVLGFFNIVLLIFAVVAFVVGCVHHLQHVLDRRRAAHAGDGAAARDRRERPAGDAARCSARRSSSACSRRRSASSSASCSRSGLKALLDALGFDIPAGHVVIAEHGRRRVFARRHRRHRRLRDRARAAGVARPADRGDARRRDRAPHGSSARGRRSASPCSRSASSLVLVRRCSAASTTARLSSARRAASCSSASSCSARCSRADRAGASARRCPRFKGMTGTLARENAMRNPKRTAATAAALMIGVALVGFITIFAASAKASISSTRSTTQFKADYIVTSRQRVRRRRSAADARRSDRRAARGRSAVAAAVRLTRHGSAAGRVHRPRVDPQRRSTSCSTSRPTSRRPRRPRRRTASRSQQVRGRRQQLEARRHRAGQFAKTGMAPTATVEAIYKDAARIVGRLLHLARSVRAELHATQLDVTRASPSSSPA